MKTLKFLKFCGLAVVAALVCSCNNDTPNDVEDEVDVVIPTKHQNPIYPTETEAAIIENANDFACRLFSETKGTAMNRCVSPISVNLALSMYANAANGETRREILDVLGYNEQNLDDVNALNEKFIRVLPNQYGYTAATYFANSIWTIPKLKIKSEFKEKMKYSYYAQFRNINFPTFQDDINSWCSENTKGMITHFPVAGTSSLKATMINTTYFQGGWPVPFLFSQKVEKSIFNNDDDSKVEVEFVEGDVVHELAYKTSNATIGKIGVGFSLVIFILPDDGVSIEDAFVNTVKNDEFANIAKPDDCGFLLKFPKFKTDTRISLTDVLTRMGCGGMFSETADYSNMTDSKGIVYGLQHIVSFEADENGVKGAATSGGSWGTGTTPDPCPIVSELILDRPFGYCVLDRYSGAVLFVGCVEHF